MKTAEYLPELSQTLKVASKPSQDEELRERRNDTETVRVELESPTLVERV